MRRLTPRYFVLTALGLLLAFVAIVPATRAQNGRANIVASPDTSYAIGYDLGEYLARRLADDQVDASTDDLLEGLRAGFLSDTPRVPYASIRDLLRDLGDQVESRRASSLLETDPVFRALADQNLKQSETFHRSYGSQRGVVTLDSGVQYQVIIEGDGEPAGLDDTVIVSFECHRVSGQEVEDEERAEIAVRGVMPGGREILTRMRPGARWKVAIPPSMAYGEAGNPPRVGPNETLIFDVELHAIKRGAQ